MQKQYVNADIQGKSASRLRKDGWKPYFQVYDGDGQPCELISYPYDGKDGPLIQVRYSTGDPTSAVERPCHFFFTVLNAVVSKRRMEIIEGNLCIVRLTSLQCPDARYAWGVFGRRLWAALQQRVTDDIWNPWQIIGTQENKPVQFSLTDKEFISTEIEKAFRKAERKERNAGALEVLNGMERKMGITDAVEILKKRYNKP